MPTVIRLLSPLFADECGFDNGLLVAADGGGGSGSLFSWFSLANKDEELEREDKR